MRHARRSAALRISGAVVVVVGVLAFAGAALADTWIVSGPSGYVSSTRATFKFTGPKKTTFSCRLDNGAYRTCTRPKTYTGLQQGAHQFYLKNSSSTHVDLREWIVDTVAPNPPAISSAPRGAVNSPTATLAFTGEVGATFQCKLGRGAAGFTACTSPKTYTGLADGAQLFQVKQFDRAGNASKTAARSWTIDTVPPAAPALTASISVADAQFSFSGEA